MCVLAFARSNAGSGREMLCEILAFAGRSILQFRVLLYLEMKSLGNVDAAEGCS
jgi:hypothetical protein